MKKILTLVVALAMVLTMGACGGSTPSSSSSSFSITNNAVKEQVLWDSENVKVTFIEIFEVDYIESTCYLRLKVENNTDKTVTVYPKDAYVNDSSILLGSGVPMELAPGKNSQAPFIIHYANIGITSKDEIQKIEFKLTFRDDSFDTVVETDNLVITFP